MHTFKFEYSWSASLQEWSISMPSASRFLANEKAWLGGSHYTFGRYESVFPPFRQLLHCASEAAACDGP